LIEVCLQNYRIKKDSSCPTLSFHSFEFHYITRNSTIILSFLACEVSANWRHNTKYAECMIEIFFALLQSFVFFNPFSREENLQHSQECRRKICGRAIQSFVGNPDS